MVTMEELEQIALIDTHAHRIHPNRELPLYMLPCCAAGPHQDRHCRTTMLYLRIIEQLRSFFDLPRDTPSEAVEAERKRRVQDDPAAYFRCLLKGTNVSTYLMENGSPLFQPLFSREEIAFFDSCIPAEKQRNIVRIERIIDEMLPLKPTFSELTEGFDKEMLRQILEEPTVAVKSCAAYYGGLEIWNVSEKESLAAYDRILSGTEDPISTKKLYQFFLMRGVEFCAQYDLPLQIHTGEGAGRFLDLRSMNPLSLQSFLIDSRILNRVRVVLLHAGHPYEEETSYLTLQFDNVYSDFSGAVWFSCANSLTRFRALLERAPLDKIMYGSDATTFPELFRYSPMQFRKILAETMNCFIQGGYLTDSQAHDAALNIMQRNALACYSRIYNSRP